MKRWGLVLAVAAFVFAPKVALAQATFPPSTTVPPTTPVPTTAPTATTAPSPTPGTLPTNGSPAQALGFVGTSAVEVGAGLMMWSAAQRARRRRKRTNDRPPSMPEQLIPIPRVVVERPNVLAVMPSVAQLYRGPAPAAPVIKTAPKPSGTPTQSNAPSARRGSRAPGDWRRS